MRVINLAERNQVYSCNVYLLLGDWNALEDVNTLIDTGRDPAVLDRLRAQSTGIGKRRVEQILLTHSHYDHVSLVPQLKTLYNPCIRAGALFSPDIDRLLEDGQTLKAGDTELEVLYTPGHSNDSVCFYCRAEKALFSGDVGLIVHSAPLGDLTDYISAMERINRLDIDVIYPGHGPPISDNCGRLLRSSLNMIARGSRAE